MLIRDGGKKKKIQASVRKPTWRRYAKISRGGGLDRWLDSEERSSRHTARSGRGIRWEERETKEIKKEKKKKKDPVNA
jgi:hypothetical protein